MKPVLSLGQSCFLVAFMVAAGAALLPVRANGLQSVQLQPKVDCTCRYKGQDYQVGDMLCLSSPDGPQLARCGFVFNNTSWNFTGTGCLYSAADPTSPRTLSYSMITLPKRRVSF